MLRRAAPPSLPPLALAAVRQLRGFCTTLHHTADAPPLSPHTAQDAGLGNHNFCRNPDGTVNPRPGAPSVWCFTTDPNKEWDFCDPCGTRTHAAADF